MGRTRKRKDSLGWIGSAVWEEGDKAAEAYAVALGSGGRAGQSKRRKTKVSVATSVIDVAESSSIVKRTIP